MRRSPARFLAPIALVAFAFALYSIIQDSRDSDHQLGCRAADGHLDPDEQVQLEEEVEQEAQDLHGQVR